MTDAIPDLLLGLAGRRRGGHGLVILTYHRIPEVADPLLPTEPAADIFRIQMAFLKQQTRVLPLGVAVGRLCAGTLPRRAVAITFDDGYANNATVALPILQQLGIAATFFIATRYLDGGCMWNDIIIEAVRRCPGPILDLAGLDLGRWAVATPDARRATLADLLKHLKYRDPAERDAIASRIGDLAGGRPLPNLMMTAAQVRQLHDAGMEIGGHTVSHPILARISPQEARSEICEGRDRLHEITGVSPRCFAYPNGRPGADFLPVHRLMVREAGFAVAVTTSWGRALPDTDPWMLPRVTLWSRTMPRLTANLLSIYLRG